MNLVVLEFALTVEVWFLETPNATSKCFLAIMKEAEDFCFTVSVLDAFVFISLIFDFGGRILIAYFY